MERTGKVIIFKDSEEAEKWHFLINEVNKNSKVESLIMEIEEKLNQNNK